jgi:small GTP-binding protein
MGEGGVGKTTLLYRYLNGFFMDSTKMTIGTDFFTKNIQITKDGNEISGKMLIWDLGGQDRFRFMMKDYMKGAEGIILAYDLTRLNTLLKITGWVNILEQAKIPVDGSIPIILIGTKKDLIDPKSDDVESRNGYIDEIKDRCKISYYSETSSVTGENIEQCFDFILSDFIKKSIKK